MHHIPLKNNSTGCHNELKTSTSVSTQALRSTAELRVSSRGSNFPMTRSAYCSRHSQRFIPFHFNKRAWSNAQAALRTGGCAYPNEASSWAKGQAWCGWMQDQNKLFEISRTKTSSAPWPDSSRAYSEHVEDIVLLHKRGQYSPIIHLRVPSAETRIRALRSCSSSSISSFLTTSSVICRGVAGGPRLLEGNGVATTGAGGLNAVYTPSGSRAALWANEVKDAMFDAPKVNLELSPPFMKLFHEEDAVEETALSMS